MTPPLVWRVTAPPQLRAFLLLLFSPHVCDRGCRLQRSQRPGPNCYDSSPLSLFHLDISTSCITYARRVTHKSVLLCSETMPLEQRQSSRSTMIITVGDHLTHQTGSGGKYAMRPACSVLTLCKRRFHSATHEEKLLLITNTNICSVAFFLQRPLLLLLRACRA